MLSSNDETSWRHHRYCLHYDCVVHKQWSNHKERNPLLAGFIIMPRHFGYKPRNVRGKGDRGMMMNLRGKAGKGGGKRLTKELIRIYA